MASFNPVRSHYEDFRVSVGDDVLARHRGIRSEVAGALSVFDSHVGVQVIPTYSARSITSGGILAASDFQRIAREFLASVRSVEPVDAVYFSLHGAMASEDEDDPEGYLLAETRKILGERQT